MTTSLRQRMTEDMQVRNLSPLTQSSYVQQVSMFARHFNLSGIHIPEFAYRAFAGLALIE